MPSSNKLRMSQGLPMPSVSFSGPDRSGSCVRGACWRKRSEPHSGLKEQLASTLERLRAANKWERLTDYPSSDHESILLLGKIGAIDLSLARGLPRFKATRSHRPSFHAAHSPRARLASPDLPR
jgi:hypothetical protein